MYNFAIVERETALTVRDRLEEARQLTTALTNEITRQIKIRVA